MKKIFVSKAPAVEEPRRRGLRFLGKSREPVVEEPPRVGLRFGRRSKPEPASTGLSVTTEALKKASSRTTQCVKRPYQNTEGTGSQKIVIAIVATLVVVVLLIILCSSGPQEQRYVARPAQHVATQQQKPPQPQERTWMKEYMQQNGQSDELRARKARMSQFQYYGDGTGQQQQN